MVSLKKIFRCLKCFSLSALFLSVCVFSYALVDSDIVLNPDLIFCVAGQKKCCIDGKMQCVDENDTNYRFCLTTCDGPVLETCNKGDVQYKPSGLCGTTSRTCCGLGSWSDWGGECPKSCDGTKPITSQPCGTNGTQTRTVTCNTSTGEWTTGSWGTCKEKVCNNGDMRTCPSNSKKVQYCLSDGSGWSTTCSCENEGNGVVYCQGMRLTTAQGNTCMHGIWSSETCSGICCCTQDIPKLMNNGYPGCWGTRTDFKGFTHSSWQYACVCQRPSSGGGGLMPNPDF